MSSYSDDFYRAAITTAYPGAVNVRKPVVSGGVSPVFLCDTKTNTVVCRFSKPEIIFHNNDVSNLLKTYSVPVPTTSVHSFLDVWFESYSYCPSATLHERIAAGMPNKDIFDVYKQAIDVQHKISGIPVSLFSPQYGRHMSEVFTATQAMRVCDPLAKLYGATHRLFSDRGEMRLLHNDIYSKNMLVCDDGKLDCLIDLDAVALCNESFSVLLALRMYPLNNYREYMDCYEDTMRRKLNRVAIENGLKILKAIRGPQLMLNKMFWRGYNKPAGR